MKQKLSSRVRNATLASLIAMIAPLTSCGDSAAAESVFLFVINGYTGSNSLTIIGPTGTVASSLAFGDRVGPVEVNRALGTEFTVLLDGTPEAIDLDLELFSMYPQETGTLFLKRRSDDAEVAVSLYRHVQTISPSCQLTFENALSLNETYLSFPHQFTYSPEFRLDDIQEGGYFPEQDLTIQTECGPLPSPPAGSRIPRDFSDIQADPYFFMTPCEDTILENQLCHVWGEYGIDLTTNVLGRPTTGEYANCLSQAVEIKQPEVDPPLPFPPDDAQVQCPPGPLTWDDVNLPESAILDCQEKKVYETVTVAPGAESNNTESIYFFSGKCTHTFRIVTPGLQTIFGPEDGDALGKHQDGDFVETTAEISPGSEHFYILFGRPVNPLVWQWDSGSNFVDLAAYPYFNGQNERIGDTDFPE
jgi:hypothetical protein